VASFLWGHGEEQRVLPELGVIQPARAFEPPVNALRAVRHSCVFRRHNTTMPSNGKPGKSGKINVPVARNKDL
jgi:hypothetical protein